MEDLFFKLLRSGLYGTELMKADFLEKIDWRQVIFLAQKQTLQGIIADAIFRLPEEIIVPPEIKQHFIDSALKIAKSHNTLNEKVVKVVKLYHSQGINAVLLKGQGIARCYRNPLMRQCGDIDLFIGKKNYSKACLLSKQKLESGDNNSHENIKHYHFNSDSIAIDLHHTAASPVPFHKKEFNKWLESELEIESNLKQIEINGTQINLPSLTFDAFFIFYHAWRHFTGEGLGLRQLCDWTMLLNKHYDEIDRLALEKVLRRFKLIRPWQLFGNIAVQYLGLPKEKMPNYNPTLIKKSQKILKLILTEGNFGFYSPLKTQNPKHLPFIKKNICKLQKATNRFKSLFQITPLEATRYYTYQVLTGSMRTLSTLIYRKK